MESASPTKHQSSGLYVKALMPGMASENALHAAILLVHGEPQGADIILRSRYQTNTYYTCNCMIIMTLIIGFDWGEKAG